MPSGASSATAAADAVPVHVLRRRSACSAVRDSPQRRRSRPSCYRATRSRPVDCCPRCTRGWWCRWVATPACPACWPPARLGIPVVVVTLRPHARGRASALAARFAAACAVAYPGSTLPRADRHRCPGAALDPRRRPGRRPRDARAALGLPDDRFVVAVIGGSLGSGVLNEAIARVRRRPRDDTGLAVRHVVGERFAGAGDRPGRDDPTVCSTRWSATRSAWISCTPRPTCWSGRGGATTVAEVAVTGTPAVLVPWSGAAEDHQTANVEWLSNGRARRSLLAEIGRRPARHRRRRAAGRPVRRQGSAIGRGRRGHHRSGRIAPRDRTASP